MVELRMHDVLIYNTNRDPSVWTAQDITRVSGDVHSGRYIKGGSLLEVILFVQRRGQDTHVVIDPSGGDRERIAIGDNERFSELVLTYG